MINEYSYCPRLFYFEQVEGVFVHNEHTAEGAVQHKRVDREGQSAPRPSDDFEEPVVVRSITLFSEKHRVIAKLDLTEFGLSNRFSVISFRVYREGLLHLFFFQPARFRYCRPVNHSSCISASTAEMSRSADASWAMS